MEGRCTLTNPFNNPNEEGNTNQHNGANEANHTNPFASANDRNDAASGHDNAQAENKETTSRRVPGLSSVPRFYPTSPQGADGGAQPANQPYGAIQTKLLWLLADGNLLIRLGIN